MERAIGFVEATAAEHGIVNPVQASIGVSDGESIWAVRYSSEGSSRTLFASAEADAVRRLHPENPRLERFRDEDRVIVSEPLVDLAGAWIEIPESSALIVRPGPDETRPFRPRTDGVPSVAGTSASSAHA